MKLHFIKGLKDLLENSMKGDDKNGASKQRN